MVAIAKTLKAKADESEVLKTELMKKQSCYQSFRKAPEDEDTHVKELEKISGINNPRLLMTGGICERKWTR